MPGDHKKRYKSGVSRTTEFFWHNRHLSCTARLNSWKYAYPLKKKHSYSNSLHALERAQPS